MLPLLSGERPPAPLWKRTSLPINFAWHHIIPYSLLRAVWNQLVQQCHDTETAEARTALRQYILMCARGFPDVDEWINRIRDDKRMDSGGASVLCGVAAWPPWNVVEGPKNRLDDVGDDAMERFTFGLTAREHLRMRRIEELYRDFCAFLAAGANPNAEAFRALVLGMQTARQDLDWADPIPFRTEMWEKDEITQKWKKRKSGEQVIPG